MSQNTGKKSLGFHLIFWLGSVCLLLLDQWTKYLACIHLKRPDSGICDRGCILSAIFRKPGSCLWDFAGGQKVFLF